jgi:mono/diheme cytochrome c family protein
VQLAAGQAPAAKETAATTFKANCEVCHGADGSGSDLGHRLHVKDLRSKEVQSKPSSFLAQTIRAGKDNMPAFGNRLDDDQINALVVFVRHKKAGSH